MQTYVNIEQIKNKHCGHFFDRATMRFFNSKVCRGANEVINGHYFITSEQFDEQSPRLYTVRSVDDSGDIESVSKFQQFETLAEAKKFAQGLTQ